MLTPAARLTSPDQNVVLTGFMGTGKTTTGRRLARRLSFDFVDTDQMIESEHGPIADIFSHHGERRFREIECSTIARLGTTRRQVISTGGATMLHPAGERILGASGRVFCLAASPDTIVARVVGSKSGVKRPLLDEADPSARVRELLAERMPRYRRFPQLHTNGGSSDSVAAELEKLATERPTIVNRTERMIVLGIGIAARAAALLADVDATVIDVGRIQPARGLDAGTLIAMQHDLAARLLAT